jgi:hypothetical protein
MGDRRSTLASECTSEVAASRKFTEIPGMTGSGRQPPNRVHASAHFSVSGNGNFDPKFTVYRKVEWRPYPNRERQVTGRYRTKETAR